MLRVTLFTICILLSSLAKASNIYFAGVGFVSTTVSAQNSLLFSTKFEERNSLTEPFFSRLYSEIEGFTLGNGDIVSTGLASLKTNNDVTLALTFESEELVINKIADNEYTLKYTLDAPILIYDVSKQSVLSSQPIRLAITDISDHYPSDDELIDFTSSVFLGLDRNIENSLLLNEFFRILEDIEIKNSYAFSIQVTDVSFSDNASNYLSKHSIDPDYYSQKLASTFSSILSTELGVPVLPFIKGDTIGRKVALRFRETGVMSLEIPEPTFSIELLHRGFATKLLEESKSAQRYTFGTGLNVKVQNNIFQEILFDRSFQLGIPKNFTKQMQIQESYWHSESIAALIAGVINQFNEYDRSWVKEHISGKYNDKDVKSEFELIRNGVLANLR